ncbi:MAG: methionine biosynthesis protein MetW [Candidatus Nitrospinota bacterium M3_3B_026]
MKKEDTGTPGPEINVGGETGSDDLAERIRRRVREKLASGVYSEKEVERIASLRPEVPEHDATRMSSRPAGEDIRSLNENWDVTLPVDTGSPRGGLAGAMVSLYKKLYNTLLHPTAKIPLSRQAEFNSSVTRSMGALMSAVDEIAGDLDDLRARQAGLSSRMTASEKMADGAAARISSLEGRGETLSERVEKLAASLRDVDKQGIFIKRRVEKLLDDIAARAGRAGEMAEAAARERGKLEGFDYTLFENIHRGTREEIKRRMGVYAEWFRGADNVLDAGCGRGELLEILRENGVTAMGVDINEEMVAECESRGLEVSAGDAMEYLKSLPEGALGGLAAVQLIEHLPMEGIAEFFKLAYEKTRPGGVVAAETINPACLTTFCGAFYLDMTHIRPIHPLAVQFLLERIGFDDVRIEYLNPYPEDGRLAPFPLNPASEMDPEFIVEYNRNVEKLNNVLYSHMDYAVVARR